MDRFVDISTDGLHLSVDRGFLSVSNGGEVCGKIPLDDIGGVVAHAHGLTWSNNLFVQLSERGIPVVLCAPNHSPVSCLWPIQGHHEQTLRLRAQAEAAKPLVKNLWQQVIVAKIQMQNRVLESVGLRSEALAMMARRVRSGDSENFEAQAARVYWPLLMGKGFRRDTEGFGANGLLNYGYAVLRSTVARAVCTTGLHPSLGLHHSNRANAFVLVDDLMEPFRPLVDRSVLNLISEGTKEVDTHSKLVLARLTTLDLESENGTGPLSRQCEILALSLVDCYLGKSKKIKLPRLPSLDLLGSINNMNEN